MKKNNYYAVVANEFLGVFGSWPQAEKVASFGTASIYKKFKFMKDAISWARQEFNKKQGEGAEGYDGPIPIGYALRKDDRDELIAAGYKADDFLKTVWDGKEHHFERIQRK